MFAIQERILPEDRFFDGREQAYLGTWIDRRTNRSANRHQFSRRVGRKVAASRIWANGLPRDDEDRDSRRHFCRPRFSNHPFQFFQQHFEIQTALMNATALFDRYAQVYDEALQTGLRISGEQSAYFATRRMEETEKALRRIDPSLVRHKAIDFGCGTAAAHNYLTRNWASTQSTA